MAISRTREYEADRDGALISGDPMSLASALDKISRLSRNFENPFARRVPGIAHLFIINPLAGDRKDSLFSTHPDVNNRIDALRQLARELASGSPGERPAFVARAPRRPSRDAAPGWRVPGTRSDRRDTRGPWG